VSRFDCCPDGRHREDELCSRTSARTLPAVEPELFDGIETRAVDLPADEPEPDERGGMT
jgi:hypothetical protein